MRPLLAGRFFVCWRVLANLVRRGRVKDSFVIIAEINTEHIFFMFHIRLSRKVVHVLLVRAAV